MAARRGSLNQIETDARPLLLTDSFKRTRGTFTIAFPRFKVIPYPPRVVKTEMSHLSREKLDLVNRTKKVIGQLESVERALNEHEPCSEVLHRLSAARGAINSLMAELMEDHIRNHMPRHSKTSEEAANDLIEIVRTYLK